MKNEISASDAVYGFCAWLTGQEEVTEFGAHKDCAVIVERVKQFLEVNNLDEPSDSYPENLTYPA